MDSDDVYSLNLVADAADGKAGANVELVTNGRNTINAAVDNKANLGSSPKYTTAADGKTIFLVADTSGNKTVYTVYELCQCSHHQAQWWHSRQGRRFHGQHWKWIPRYGCFIEKNASMTMASDNQDIIYIKAAAQSVLYLRSGYYYEYDAFINGQESTVKTSAVYSKDALVYGPIYNEKGIMTGAQSQALKDSNTNNGLGGVSNTAGTDSVTNDVIKLGNTHFAYTSDVEVYFVDVDGKLEASTITGIAADQNDQVFYKTNDKGLLTDVYVKVVDETETVTPGAGVLSATALAKDSSGDLVASVTLTGPAAGAMTFNVTVERYMEATNIWQTAATGTVTVANGNSAGQSAALIANGSLVNGALYRVTATYNGGSVTSGNFTA